MQPHRVPEKLIHNRCGKKDIGRMQSAAAHKTFFPLSPSRGVRHLHNRHGPRQYLQIQRIAAAHLRAHLPAPSSSILPRALPSHSKPSPTTANHANNRPTSRRQLPQQIPKPAPTNPHYNPFTHNALRIKIPRWGKFQSIPKSPFTHKKHSRA